MPSRAAVAGARGVVALVLALATSGCVTAGAGTGGVRPLRLVEDGRWPGRGIAYGPHRDGQHPGGPSPTRAQLREDLELLRGRWDLLRVYGSAAPTPELLTLIREERLPFRVLLGAWIAPESAGGEGRTANRAEVEAAVRLANAYPDIVPAIVVGNETQVSWSAHRLPADVLVGWIRVARRGTAVPVGTADDFSWWERPESTEVARELDFVVVHVHPLWNGRTLDDALAFTRERRAAVARRHRGLPVVLGETGWATRRLVDGEQGKLMRGVASEEAQRRFLLEYTAWVERERLVGVWFEAFDEAWKGGPDPDDAEKHWGLWRSDRTPKAALETR